MIVEALGVSAIAFESAQAADEETAGASAA